MRNQAAFSVRVRALAMVAALVPVPVTAKGAPPETAPVGPDDIYEPIEIPPPPEPAVVPEPTPEPQAPAVEGPQPARLDPEQLAKIDAQRKAGVVVMGTGGVLAAAGFGMTLAFTVLGDQAQELDEPVLEDIERNNSLTRVGGVALASGVALVAVGGILFTNANRKAEQRRAEAMARVRVAPAVGGLVVSGQF
jgi:hypothetical protein